MQAFTIWFTGLSGSGKTTLAQILANRLKCMGHKVEMLDGDIIRQSLSKDLGFSKEDRDENIKRVGFICELLTRNGIIAIASCISPYRAARDNNRKKIGSFFEIYTRCSINECIKRDPKGNYKKFLEGQIKDYTGMDDPYEEPLNPEVVVNTENESIEESTEKIIKKMKEFSFFHSSEETIDTNDEKKIKEKLKKLGYI